MKNDKEMEEPSVELLYKPTIDYLNNITGTLSAATKQFSLGTEPNLGTTIAFVLGNASAQMSNLLSIESSLPRLATMTTSTALLDMSRRATSSIAELMTTTVINGLTASLGTSALAWSQENMSKISMDTLKLGVSEIAIATQGMSSILGSSAFSGLSLQAGLLKATEFSVSAEKSLAYITMGDIGKRISMTTTTQSDLQSSILGLSQSYSDLFESFETIPTSYLGITQALTRAVPIEYFSSASVLESISIEKVRSPKEELLEEEMEYENDFKLRDNLPKIHPDLFNMWKGAIEAYTSKGTDWVRHFSASIRELLTHLLHMLAPDAEISKWTREVDMFHEGRPTRKARILYICRNIANDNFNQFVKKDVEATIAFISLFQEGTHAINPSFTPEQLIAIKNKAESTVRFLVEIEISTNK